MQGKTVVITGATSGIGEVAALELAGKGARIVFVARDRNRGEATLAKLDAKAPGLSHKVHYADLSLVAEMKRVAAEIAASEPRIDVLDQQCRRGLRAAAGYGRRFRADLRAQSSFLFCDHGWLARKAVGLDAGAHRQHIVYMRIWV